MITLRNLTTNVEHIVTPTNFFDGTQQVWKLPEDILKPGDFEFVWHFENDAELVTLMQLKTLIETKVSLYDHKYSVKYSKRNLIIPFLPYSRQDKEVSNETTFGLCIFLNVLNAYNFTKITTLDVHNKNTKIIFDVNNFENKTVNEHIQQAIELSGADLVCFPDKGASERGYEVTRPSFHLSKKRNQATGAIEGLVCDLPLNLADKKVLIVDDIVCGGATFVGAAKILKQLGASSVSLYATHGILSKGVHVLTESGIDHIYITDSFKTKANLTDKVTVFKLGV